MPLKLYKRGDIWHYRGTVAKRRLRGSTETANKELAEEVIADIETRERRGRIYGPASVLTFSQAVLRYRAAGKSARFLEPIEDKFKDTLVKELNSGTIRQAAIEVYPNVSGATRNRQFIVPVQAIINHSAEAELCPRITVKRFETTKKVKKPASLPWVRSFMAAAEQPHLSALALFLFTTGARITEALSVEWDDVNLQMQTVVIKATKIGEERTSHLPRELVVALGNIRQTEGRSVFRYVDRNSASMEWRKVLKRAGLERLSFHCCRHGFATWMLRNGVDVKTTMYLGGWHDATLFMDTYAHAINDLTLTDRLLSTDTQLTQAMQEVAASARKIV